MKCILLSAVILTSAMAFTSAANAKTDWWEVAADVLDLTNQVLANKNPIASGSTNRSQRKAGYVTEQEYKNAPYMYTDWIQVDRKRHSFSPEYFDQFCSFPMRAGLIEYPNNGKECPRFVMVHPNEFY